MAAHVAVVVAIRLRPVAVRCAGAAEFRDKGGLSTGEDLRPISPESESTSDQQGEVWSGPNRLTQLGGPWARGPLTPRPAARARRFTAVFVPTVVRHRKLKSLEAAPVQREVGWLDDAGIGPFGMGCRR